MPTIWRSCRWISARRVITRSGAASSQNEQDSRHYARAAKVPMLEPSDSQEAKDLVAHAFELSEQFDASTGYEKSVRNLTWSYAAFLSAARARAAVAA